MADAEGFITKSVMQRAPFLWYMPFPQCHVSMFTNTSFTNTSKNGIFGDQIREMDWAVGKVRDAVRAQGVANQTIFFFSRCAHTPRALKGFILAETKHRYGCCEGFWF